MPRAMTEGAEAQRGCGLVAVESGAAIPLSGVSVEAQIRDGSVRMVLAQRYVNTGKKALEAVYTFPLDEGAAVCGFEAVVNGKVFRGAVEEREKAFERYDDAMAAGDGAFLLDEERPDVFTMSVGNLPPGGEALLRITTVAEAPREGDGIRWLLPTTVSPRYAPAEDRKGVGRTAEEAVNPPVSWSVPYGLELAVSVEMGSAIRSIESPSHPISAVLDGSRATVRLGERATSLDRDFVLLVHEAEPAAARVLVEAGGEGRSDAAVKIVFPPLASAGDGAAPGEVVFVVDRSGSMEGSSIAEARNALQLCLRSLPGELLFNVVGFGTTFEKLFPKSRPYGEKTLAEASRYVAEMDAEMGGTEILPALESVLAGEPPAGGRVVLLLTDGEVSNFDEVLACVGAHAAGSRVFTFGIGAGASVALVRGIARAGRGACELIAPGERIEAKVVRQLGRALKGALSEAAIDWDGLSVRQAPARIESLFAGEPTTVTALLDGLKPATVTLSARAADGRLVTSSVRVEPEAAREGVLLATLAARGLIRDLEEGVYARRGSKQERGGADRVKEKIVALAKAYGIASRETSFVVVEEKRDKVTGEVEMVRVPVALTRGWGGASAGKAHGARLVATFAAMRVMCADLTESVCADAAPSDDDVPFLRRLMKTPAKAASRKPIYRAPAPGSWSSPSPGTSRGPSLRPLDALVSLQRADGSWELEERLAEVLGLPLPELRARLAKLDFATGARAERLFATALALELLTTACATEEDEWRLLAEKARRLLEVSLYPEVRPLLADAAKEAVREGAGRRSA